jgi:carbamoyl-phosphate synthase large subunit
MRSTGEVAALGRSLEEALLKSWLSAEGNNYPGREKLVIVYNPLGKSDKQLENAAKRLLEAGYRVYTVKDMEVEGLDTLGSREAINAIRRGDVGLVVTTGYAPNRDYAIRRASVDFNASIILDSWLAELLAASITALRPEDLEAKELREYYN